MKKTLTTTFTVNFHLKKAGEKDGKMPIYARITVNGKRIELSARNLIEPFHWNEKRGAAKPLNDSYWAIFKYEHSALIESPPVIESHTTSRSAGLKKAISWYALNALIVIACSKSDKAFKLEKSRLWNFFR